MVIATVIGGGSYGTVMARVMCLSIAAPSQVKLWVRRQEVCDEVNLHHTNSQYTGPAHIPPNVVATTSIADALQDTAVVVLAVPHQFLDELLPLVREHLSPGVQVVSLIKGFAFDESTCEITPLSQRISRDLGDVEVSVLMGPTIYTEMANDEFAEVTLGCSAGNQKDAQLLQDLFSSPLLAVSLSTDVVGVELCGGLKNCYTLGCGFCAGLGMGMNVKAALMRAAQRETVRLWRMFFPGVNEATFSEACGIGDLVLSCTVGRGQRLAAAFLQADRKKSWAELEEEQLGGQKIPDWHNIREVHLFLASRGAVDKFPLLRAINAIAHIPDTDPRSIVSALQESLTMPLAPSSLKAKEEGLVVH